ncbi:hypothetical protein BGZ76_008650 [Entomortierella beljakovae]|nr:hypothetical protein BGZ76_008650 [Entomortierella beljakovae]
MQRDKDSINNPGSFKSAWETSDSLKNDIDGARNATFSNDYAPATAMRAATTTNPNGDIFNVGSDVVGGMPIAHVEAKSRLSRPEEVMAGAAAAGTSVIEAARKLVRTNDEDDFDNYDGNEDALSTSNQLENQIRSTDNNQGLEFSHRSLRINKKTTMVPTVDLQSPVSGAPQRKTAEEPDMLMGISSERQYYSSNPSNLNRETQSTVPSGGNRVPIAQPPQDFLPEASHRSKIRQTAPIATATGVAASLSEMMNHHDVFHPYRVHKYNTYDVETTEARVLLANQEYNAKHVVPVATSGIGHNNTTLPSAANQHVAYLAKAPTEMTRDRRVNSYERHSVAPAVAVVGASAIASVGALTTGHFVRNTSNEDTLRFTDPETHTPLTETITTTSRSSTEMIGERLRNPSEHGSANLSSMKSTNPMTPGVAKEMLPSSTVTETVTTTVTSTVTTGPIVEPMTTSHIASSRDIASGPPVLDSFSDDIKLMNKRDKVLLDNLEFDVTNDALADTERCPLTFTDPKSLRPETNVRTIAMSENTRGDHSSSIEQLRHESEYGPAQQDTLLYTTFATSGLNAGRPHPSKISKDIQSHERPVTVATATTATAAAIPHQSEEPLLTTFATSGMNSGMPHPSTISREVAPPVEAPLPTPIVGATEIIGDNTRIPVLVVPLPQPPANMKVLNFTDPKTLTPLTGIRLIPIEEELHRRSLKEKIIDFFSASTYGPADPKELHLTDPKTLGQNSVRETPKPVSRKAVAMAPPVAAVAAGAATAATARRVVPPIQTTRAAPIPAPKPVATKVTTTTVTDSTRLSNSQGINPSPMEAENLKNVRLTDTSPLRPLSERVPTSAPVKGVTTNEMSTHRPIPLLAPLPTIAPIDLPINKSNDESTYMKVQPIAPIPEFSSTTLADNSVSEVSNRPRRSTNPFDGMTSKTTAVTEKEVISSKSVNPLYISTSTTTTTTSTSVPNAAVAVPVLETTTVPKIEERRVPEVPKTEIHSTPAAAVHHHDHTLTNDKITEEPTAGSSVGEGHKYTVVPENYSGPIPKIKPDEEIVWMKTTTTTTYPAGQAPPPNIENVSISAPTNHLQSDEALAQTQALQEAEVHAEYAPIEIIHPKKKGFFNKLFGRRNKEEKGKGRL